MTAQIIKLSDHRRARQKSQLQAMLWPYVVSIEFCDAYLAIVQALIPIVTTSQK